MIDTRLRTLVILPRVLHVLELDQDLGLGWDGEAEHGSRRVARPRAALLALASQLPCSQMLPPRTRRTFAPSRARRCPSPHTACTEVAASRARRCPPHSLHWLRCLRARRCPPALLAVASHPPCSQMLAPRTPCSGRSLPCSQMPEPPHSLHWGRCLRARRSLPPGTPCRNTLGWPCRARVLPLPAPRPSADASRAPGAWRNARSIVTHNSVAALPEPPTRFGRLKLSGVFGRRRKSSKWRGPGRVIVLGRSEAHSRFARSRRWRSCRRASSRARTTRR